MYNIRSDYNFERNNKILEDYLINNKSLAEIARDQGLTRQRVSVVIKDMTAKGFTNRLGTNAKKQIRNDYLNRAVEVRESGNLEFSESMLGEVLEWDKKNSNLSGYVDVLGHLRIVYTTLAQKSNKKLQIGYYEKAKDCIDESIKIIEKNKKVFTNGTLGVFYVHKASVLFGLSNLQNKSEEEKLLKSALKLINRSLEILPGSLAHKAWPLRIKSEILICLKKYDLALKTLHEAQENIFAGYKEEVKNDKQSKIKILVWLSGIQLSLAKLALAQKNNILAEYYAKSVLAYRDSENNLALRKKEAKEILQKI